MTDTADYGSGLSFGGGPASPGTGTDALPPPGTPLPISPAATPAPQSDGFGSMLKTFGGARYTPPDPASTPLDQTSDLLQQRITRANQVASNPVLQFFNPEGVQAARAFVPQATEQLQKIKTQKADMAANRQQAETLGLAPGEVSDEATQADRVELAKAKALKGNLAVFKGLQAVDPKAAEAIQDQVHEVTAGHLEKAQFAFDKLSNMHSQGEYDAAVQSLRHDGTLTDLEALGMKVAPSFDAFNAGKAREGQALREARVGIDTLRQKLEDRNTYQPMEEKEAKTYGGRLKTVYGDELAGTWSNNKASGVRGLVVNGAADPRELGKSFNLATPDQRKAFHEDTKAALDEKDLEKYRNFNRTRTLAVTDEKGDYIPPEGKLNAKGQRVFMNTNPNVQQGVAEGLASMLRGGSGGATSGLLNIETGKRGYVQAVIDKIMTNYAGGVNTLTGDQVKPYLSQLTQEQQRSVLDGLAAYTAKSVSDRVGPIAQRAGALGLDSTALGLGKGEVKGVEDAIEAGRQAQIARMLPFHQAIGGGDGVFQLGAQRPGVGATSAPPGTAPATQIPSATALQTPVQQAGAPPAPAPSQPVPPPAPSAATPPATAPQPGPAGGGPAPAPAAPVQIGGQQIIAEGMPPGASPGYITAAQRIESGRSKDPWTASTGNGPNGKPMSSASGAYQMTDSTWNDNKPPGAPARAKDATPQQQTQAFVTLTNKSAGALTKAGVPVNDNSLYVTHNLGLGAGPRLLQADPNADARTVVGEIAARNNPTFFKGKPTVATVLQRYETEMGKEPPKLPGTPENTDKPGLLTRISRMLSQGVPGSGADKDAAVHAVGDVATEHAPVIGGTIGGMVGGVPGAVAGGSGGQALKDYLQGRSFDPKAVVTEGALSGVLGVGSAARPVLAAGARVAGAGAVRAGEAAAGGGDTSDVIDAGVKGAAGAAGGEMFGRALGMAGHKVFSMFGTDAQKTVQSAAKSYHDAQEVLRTETPKLPGAAGQGSTANPKYEAAQAASDKAETVLKDAGLKPEEAAYAHKVSSEGVPKQEAQIARPGEVEKQRVGAGYQQLESEVGAAGKGAPKAAPKLADGPIAAVENKQVSTAHKELAEHVEMAITAPAKNWQEKWTQLKDARSQLLQAERDAAASTAPGKTKIAADMRALADTVRTQQAKAAKYVFGEKDGEAFMGRLKVLDTRYRNLMDATNNGDLMKAAKLTGDAGREAEKKFVAFAHDDPEAIAAYRAVRRGGSNIENDVRTLVGAEGLPVIGHVISAVKMASRLREWAQERAAGAPVKFADLMKTPGFWDSDKHVRDITGAIGARAATM